MKRKVTLLLLLFCMLTLHAQEVYKTVKDLPYIAKSETDAYRKERCKLDVYYPVDKKDFPTIVWFHGGGLEGGGKHIPQELMNRGFAVIFVVVIFIYMSLRLQKQKDEDRNFIETYTITLEKGFIGDSLSLMINDSVLVNKKITEEPFSMDVKRFAEQSALLIVDKATDQLSLFELSEKGGNYRFEKENGEVKQLAQK